MRDSVKNTPGNLSEVYVCEAPKVISVTTTSVTGLNISKVTAITMAGTAKFKRIQADIDTVQWTSENQSSTTSRKTQNLVVKVSGSGKKLLALEEDLSESIPSGIVAIHVDGNGKAYISGISSSVGEGKMRPYNKVSINYDSGTTPSDEGMASATITFTRSGKEGLTIFAATSQAKIVQTQNHAAIKWT